MACLHGGCRNAIHLAAASGSDSAMASSEGVSRADTLFELGGGHTGGQQPQPQHTIADKGGQQQRGAVTSQAGAAATAASAAGQRALATGAVTSRIG